jgi:hypothetical protein
MIRESTYLSLKGGNTLYFEKYALRNKISIYIHEYGDIQCIFLVGKYFLIIFKKDFKG